MNKHRSNGQTLIELLILLLPFVLSFVLAKIFFRYIGWWGVLPGIVLGFGSVALLFHILFGSNSSYPRVKRRPGGEDESKSGAAEPKSV
jgi:uncharacterized membrane protein